MENNSLEKKDFGDLVYEHFGPGEEGGGKLKRVLEFMIYFVGFLGTIFALLQAYKIWFVGDLGDASIISWGALASFTPFWILYGIMHKKRSLVMTYVVWLVINLIVVVGIIVKG